MTKGDPLFGDRVLTLGLLPSLRRIVALHASWLTRRREVDKDVCWSFRIPHN